MKLKSLSFLGLSLMSFLLSEQSLTYDSLFTKTGLLVGNVKEVNQESIKFTYPKEEVINVLLLCF